MSGLLEFCISIAIVRLSGIAGLEWLLDIRILIDWGAVLEAYFRLRRNLCERLYLETKPLKCIDDSDIFYQYIRCHEKVLLHIIVHPLKYFDKTLRMLSG